MAWYGVIWTPQDWLNKLYSCYMATAVAIITGCCLGIGSKRGKNSQTHFCLFWYKQIMSIFGFFKGCQILLHIMPWTVAVFTCWCLPYLAKMSTIFILLYISLHSGFFHYACQIWQKFTIFQKWKPKPYNEML